MSHLRILLLLVVLLSRTDPATADPVPEYAMKAAYLYNFSLFTEWPNTMGDTLNLCVLGEDAFGKSLDDLAGKPVNGRKLAIRRIKALADAHPCEVLYFGESERPRIKRIRDEIGRTPVLTITDAEGMAREDAMIIMLTEGRRIIFQINAENARRAGLVLSSKLLHLAAAVY